MPIDKLTPRQLDADSDSKLVKKTAMLDALNLYSGDTGGSGGDGDMGVLKNIKGNVQVTEAEALPDDARVIGKVEDKKTSLVYLFVYSETAAEQGVWAYDPLGRLPNSETNSLRLIYKSAQFNFPQDGFVKGDIVYSNARTEEVAAVFGELGVDFEKDSIIYFTDNTNEPRKINAYRALLANGSAIHGEEDIYAEADFITACPKTPLEPIVFNFSSEPTKTTNAFDGKSGYQFAYQYVYKDGMESAISCYSAIAFPPSIITQGSNSYVDHSFFNKCSLTIPAPGPEISAVKILAREGNTGSFSYVDKVSVQQLADLEGVYDFYNNKVVTGVSSDEVNKQFDYLPRKAEAQAVSSNRMLYGNYLEGFDAVETECEGSVFYIKRKEDFLSFDVKVKPAIFENEDQSDDLADLNKRKTAGFNIDVSELPSTYDSGTEVFLNLTFSPNKNWHVYNSDKSYHQSRSIGSVSMTPVSYFMTGINLDPELQDANEAGQSILSEGYPVLCKNIGVGSDLSWQVVSGVNDGELRPTTIGTSAGHPLIFPSGALNFKVKFLITSAVPVNGKVLALDVIKNVFTLPLEEAQSAVESLGWPVTILEGNHEWDYEVNLGIENGEIIQGDYSGEFPSSATSTRICCAGQAADAGQFEVAGDVVAPDGYFVVDHADLKFSLNLLDDSPPESASFSFLLKEVRNVEVVTALKVWQEGVGDWIALSLDYAQAIQEGEGSVDDISESHNENDFQIPDSTSNNINQIGYLVHGDEDSVNPLYDEASSGIFCLFDGEGGPSGSYSRGGDSGLLYDTLGVYNHPSVNYGTLYNGTIAISDYTTNLPLIQVDEIFPIPFASDVEGEEDELNVGSVNFSLLHPHVELIENQVYINEENPYHKSFKTNADHDFGIVYYDERGRHGFVNHLQTVFVKGYSEAERGFGAQGRAEIELKLLHQPPDWAFRYKIVYAKNTSWGDYVQYSAGGAFVIESPQEITQNNQNIYVSLNYLQGHRVSYVSSWGARTPEGGLNFVKTTEGAKLRVISSANGDNRDYAPSSYEFDVIEVVKLGPLDNPLASTPQSNHLGDFLVIKNNPNASGFTHADIVSGSDLWRNNCIIEVLTPLAEKDIDQVLYHELPKTYSVVNDLVSGELVHEENPIRLRDGDVWFRKVPVNVREKEAGVFVDIINPGVPDENADINESLPNFKSVYLETKSVTDLFRSDSLSIGRPNVILEDALETIREATITYSGPSNPESKKVNYSSFNGSLANFKDLSEKHGSINYISDQSDSILAIQENKVSRIPVNRSLLADVKGSSSIIASRNILGEAIHYPGESGCDNDPSSVADIEDAVFFANKSLGKIYRFDRNGGVKAVSDLQVASLFRNMFKDALADVPDNQHVRVVGGYDPVKEEYLITVVSLDDKKAEGVVVIEQPNEDTIAPGGDDDDDDDGGGGVGPGGGDDDDGGGDDDDGGGDDDISNPGDDDISNPGDDDGPKPIVIDDSGFYPG